MANSTKRPVQASRHGRTAITFFIKNEGKAPLMAALADGGYGTSFQEGMVRLVNEFLEASNRRSVC